MTLSPQPDDFASFIGTVHHETPCVAVNSTVEIEPEGEGWRLIVMHESIPSLTSGNIVAWDIWCDTWADADIWFTQWQVTWNRTTD